MLRNKNNIIDAAFIIHVDDENLVSDNAQEHFSKAYGDKEARKKALKQGFIQVDRNDHVTITPQGWEILVLDSRQLEDNALKWLANTFSGATEHGHDSNSDLVGAFWFDNTNMKQLKELDGATHERIDFSDSSYGSFAKVAWDRISNFGQQLLGGAIYIEKVTNEQIEDYIEALNAKKKPSKKQMPPR